MSEELKNSPSDNSNDERSNDHVRTDHHEITKKRKLKSTVFQIFSHEHPNKEKNIKNWRNRDDNDKPTAGGSKDNHFGAVENYKRYINPPQNIEIFGYRKNENSQERYADLILSEKNMHKPRNFGAGENFRRHVGQSQNENFGFRKYGNEYFRAPYEDLILPEKNIRTDPAHTKFKKVDFNNEAGDGENFKKIGKIITFVTLEKLCEKSDVCEIMRVMGDKRSGFFSTLTIENLRPASLILITRLIRKICDSELKASKIDILGTLLNSKFLDQIIIYLNDIVTDSDKWNLKNMPQFIFDLSIFFETVVDIMPYMAYNKDLTKIITKTLVAAGSLPQFADIEIDESCVTSLNTTLGKLKEYSKIESEKPKRNHWYEMMATLDPPDNFRSISLFPTLEDVTNNKPVFIRPNITEGAYSSVDHYLDVQFRLLREDFIAPLRNGLKKFNNSISEGCKKQFRFDSVRLYPNTTFVKDFIEHDKVGYVICFDPNSKLRNLNWEYNKRFMYGSLLLFTADNFQSFFMATVLDRNLQNLKKGLLTVRLVNQSNILSNCNTFLMAESEVYFEPYYLVMKSLQSFKGKNFPMTKYIVNCEKIPDVPKYVTKKSVYEIDGVDFDILDETDWPEAELFKLDDYQYKALKMALTKEFSVIQGPPGTGKTFIGLKIMKILLANVKNDLFHGLMRSPILLVCFTNHALDQFLEGVLEYTQKIVRIGQQSNNEKLQKYNLRGLYYKTQGWSSHNTRNLRAEVKEVYLKLISIHQKQSRLGNNEGVISVKLLNTVMSIKHSKILNTDEKLIDWLFQDIPNLMEFKEIPNLMDLDLKQIADTEGQHEDEDDFIQRNYDIIDEDDIFDISKESFEPEIPYAINLLKLRSEIEDCRNEIKQTYDEQREFQNYTNFFNIMRSLQYKLEEKEKWFNILYQKMNQQEIQNSNFSVQKFKSLQNLTPDERWGLYNHWVKFLKEKLTEEFRNIEMQYRRKSEAYEELKQLDDINILTRSDVVGMTTTGAARLQTMLRTLKPAIVIVEEAAEVLEAHILVSLTKGCEHVILIGDHKQLKPNTAVFELAKNYNFDLSLFERMLNNGMECPRLNVQHRMRPEICRLIVPHIYEDLENHPSVFEFENIPGVTKNVFFIHHDHPEEEVVESNSRKNIHEADFMIELCRYLILQGIKPEKITILTTYTGQMFHLRQAKKVNAILKEVRMIVVDKYQGEENDVILLSLVRSNKDGKVGFLKMPNRVCVALSRARKGFFMIGNMENLTSSSTLWKKIEKTLKDDNALDTHLTLVCQIHNKITNVSKAEDFSSVIEGGCDAWCHALLACGHNCKRLCHVVDREHQQNKCHEECPKRCSEGHPCPLKCHEGCRLCLIRMTRTLECGHSHEMYCHEDPTKYKCNVPVDATLPHCGHQVSKPCYVSVENAKCSMQCEDRLDCGHACTRKCHKNNDPEHSEFKCRKPCAKLNKGCKMEHSCAKQCYEECGVCSIVVEQTLPCGHKDTIPCAADFKEVKCLKRCIKKKECGHPCKKKCHQNCGPCTVKVEKEIALCGHKIIVECHEEPIPSQCREPCPRIMSCGHMCTGKCGDSCDNAPCKVLVTSPIIPACGHEKGARIRCFQKSIQLEPDSVDLLSYCQEKCDAILKCKDVCSGTCGGCWQGKLHIPCQQKCGNILICGHACESPCREVCPPCQKPCTYRCTHSKCSKICGYPCTRCYEWCDWNCKHMRCNRKCGEFCNRPPCFNPCRKKLKKCGHRCIGFCGEPCPPLCRFCDKEEVTTIFLGYEDEDDARFVLLNDCQHVIESKGLNQALKAKDSDEIVMKVCPLCKTPILTTLRFMHHVRQTYRDIIQIKRKIFGSDGTINKLKWDLRNKLKIMTAEMDRRTYHEFKEFTDLRSEIDKLFQRCENRLFVYQDQLIVASYIVDVMLSLRIKISIKQEMSKENFKKLEDWISNLCTRILNCNFKISPQTKDDLSNEIYRYLRLIDLYVLENSPSFRMVQLEKN